MRAYDTYAIKTLGISSATLMENAGRECVRLLIDNDLLPKDETISILCGSGNNGGDGLVIARVLADHGITIQVFIISRMPYSPEFRKQLSILKNSMSRKSSVGGINLYRSKGSTNLVGKLKRSGVIIDAVFGTGYRGDLSAKLQHVFRKVNSLPVTRISVDIPSGMNASTGSISNNTFRADLTITFGGIKRGHLLHPGRIVTGTLIPADIGLPSAYPAHAHIQCRIPTLDDISSWMPARPRNAHKYISGKVLVIAGSKNYTGAPVMTAQSALRSGCGAVVLACPDAIQSILSKKVTEVIVEGHSSDEQGAFSFSAFESLQKRIAWADVIAIGPGLSRGREIAALVRMMLALRNKKFVIDADALSVLSPARLRGSSRNNNQIIITPHEGEYSQLFVPAKGADPINEVLDRSKETSCVIVRKGSPTITALPQGTAIVNITGNEGMATIGTGDVLTGMISSLFAQGMQKEKAAIAGVFLHGLAGDRSSEKKGKRSLVATDLIESIPTVLKELP